MATCQAIRKKVKEPLDKVILTLNPEEALLIKTLVGNIKFSTTDSHSGLCTIITGIWNSMCDAIPEEAVELSNSIETKVRGEFNLLDKIRHALSE